MLTEHGCDLDIHFSQGQVSSKTLLQIIHNYYRSDVDEERFSSAQLEIVLKACKSNLEDLDRTLLEMVKKTTPLEPQCCFLKLLEQLQHHLSISQTLEGDKADLKELFLSHLSGFKKTGFYISQEEMEESAEEIIEAMLSKTLGRGTFEGWIQKGLPVLEMMAPDNAKQRKKKTSSHPLQIQIEFWRTKILPIIEQARNPWRILAAMGSDFHPSIKNCFNFLFPVF